MLYKDVGLYSRFKTWGFIPLSQFLFQQVTSLRLCQRLINEYIDIVDVRPTCTHLDIFASSMANRDIQSAFTLQYVKTVLSNCISWLRRTFFQTDVETFFCSRVTAVSGELSYLFRPTLAIRLTSHDIMRIIILAVILAGITESSDRRFRSLVCPSATLMYRAEADGRNKMSSGMNTRA